MLTLRFLLLGLLLFAAPSSRAQTQPTAGGGGQTVELSAAKTAVRLPPEKSRPVRIPRFEKPPLIYGVLEEEVWNTAAVLK